MFITPLIGFGQTASIEVTKTWTLENDLDNNNIVNVGDQIKFIISVKNDGNETLTNIVYDDTFLDGSTPPNLLSFDPPSNPRTLTWIASDGGSFEGMLNAGETAYYHAYYTVTQEVYDSGEATNTVAFFGVSEGTTVSDVSDNGNDIDGNTSDDVTRIPMGVQHGNMTDIILNGSVSVENNQIKNVADPTHTQDVTTKNYVDSLLERIEQLENQVDVLEDYSDVYVGNLDNITDIDGNEYPIVEIGGQKWVSKNLSVKSYRDGTPIPHVQDPVEWENLTTGAYRYVNNDPDTESKYGLMYNYYAVNNPRGLSPKGTRIPSLNDFIHLTSFLGYPCHEDSSPSNELFKGILTNDNSVTWNNTDGSQIIGTNTTGFNLYPSGWFRYSGDTNTQYGKSSFLWTSEGPHGENDYYMVMRFSSTNSTTSKVANYSLLYFKSGLCVRVIVNN